MTKATIFVLVATMSIRTMAANLHITSEEMAYAVIAEVNRLINTPAPEFVDKSFPKQAAFVNDPSSRIAALCTRRAGKSYGIGLRMSKDAYETPECSVIYLALTRDSAKRIMWKDVLKPINRKLGLGIKFNEASLTATFPNGSVIYLFGADSNSDEMEKVLGSKLKTLVIDETGSFRQDLRKLVYEMAEPALADYDGSVILIGTPTDLTKSLFYDVTMGKEPGWSLHTWNTFDNPHMAEKWKVRLDRLVALNPRVVETPAYKRMYLGQWVVDADKLCYKFDVNRNRVEAIPKGNYQYVLGIDLGYEDASAFVVGAYREFDKKLYLIDVFKQSKMTLTSNDEGVPNVEDKINYFRNKYELNYIVVDGANKQAVKELERRLKVPLIPADKTGKADFIEIMSSEYIQNNVQLLMPVMEALADEYVSLIWDDKSLKKQEHPACENHAADAALYLWRHCYNYLAAKPPVTKSEEERMEEAMEEELISDSKEDKPFWDKDWEVSYGT